MGGFYRTLCLAIQKADHDNLTRLRQGFPELVPLILDEGEAMTPREVEDEFEAKP